MLITFKSKRHGDILMFGSVALELIELMGHRATVPGAIAAEDVAKALQCLENGLSARTNDETDKESVDDAQGNNRGVSLTIRARPLLEMLQEAARNRDYLMWE